MALTTVDSGLISSGAITLTTQVTGTLPEANGGTGTTVGYCGFKNKIFNGQMQIDQRNAGASKSLSAVSSSYMTDRWFVNNDADSVLSAVQDTIAPTGFTNSLKVTVTTADASIGSTQNSYVAQWIEGFNTADLGFGTASAQTVTLSFWVRSSLTGTFGGALTNSAVNRSYPFTYTISAANTWEQKSVTIAGDITGTWVGATNGIGIRVWFALGTGSTYLGTAGAWAGSEFRGATGQTQVISTLNATWQVTGVQLEKGSTATSFDYRPYGTELALCQRYYEKSDNQNTSLFWCGNTNTSATYYFPVKYVVTKRTGATVAILDILNSGFPNTITAGEQSAVGFRADSTSNSTGAANYFRANWTASAEL